MTEFPTTQNAIEIYGVDQVRLNHAKPVPPVRPTQILLKMEASGICFSDTKLMHAFDHHPRKSEVLGGLTSAELAEIPTYRPGSQPVVPGHEPVARIVAGREAPLWRLHGNLLFEMPLAAPTRDASASAAGHSGGMWPEPDGAGRVGGRGCELLR